MRRCDAATFIMLISSACAGTDSALPEHATPHVGIGELAPTPASQSRAMLEKLSPNRLQLWVVVQIRAHKHILPDGSIDEQRLIAGALEDSAAVVDGGGPR